MTITHAPFLEPRVTESDSGGSKPRGHLGVMSENVVMCKIAHFCTFLCVILTNFMRDFYVLTKYKPIDAKIAHSLPK